MFEYILKIAGGFGANLHSWHHTELRHTTYTLNKTQSTKRQQVILICDKSFRSNYQEQFQTYNERRELL